MMKALRRHRWKRVAAPAQPGVLAVILAALAMSVTASPLPVDKAQSAPAASAALVEQAQQHGLTIEQERYIQSQPKGPEHHWEGYSDKPVAAKLGPNTFMFPMNLYDDQIGPDFQGSVAFMLHWPDLKPFPPGARHDPKYSEAYMSENIMVSLYYVDRRPIDSLIPSAIKPYGLYDKDDPTRSLSTRIQGDAFEGLVPYYADLPRVASYFKSKGISADKDNLVRSADDWYLAYDDHGVLRTFISCTSREEVGARLIDGHIENTPAGKERGMCKQEFVIEKFRLHIVVNYLRAYLSDWQKIENDLGSLIDNGYKPTL
jgi:hypothetical protein